MKHFTLTILLAGLGVLAGRVHAASVIITGQTAGPTPFISQLQLTASPPNSIMSVKFEITPKAGSVTRPLAATYTSEYLKRRGYYNSQTGAILLSVFGLYNNYTNNVTLTYTFTDNSSQQANVMITTSVYVDSCGYTAPTVVQARTNTTTLSYDYIFVRNGCTSPAIIDTDGQLRWVPPGGFNTFATRFFQNSIYIGNPDAILYRMEFDGTYVALHNFSTENVNTFHHNIDTGKRGFILDVHGNGPTEFGAINMEVDGLGNVLEIWNLATIISNAMTAGGDGAHVSEFVTPNTDWFHNNATTYKASDDTLLVSSRENFVIALDYTTGTIKWILGDATKQWHQFQSLKNFALTLGTNTLPPIGQHAVSITNDNNLLLFDNGRSSLNHTPTGADRVYSAPRKYQINTQAKVATELWNYVANPSLYSQFCSSVYEDATSNYLVDYAILGTAPNQLAETLGLDASGSKIFHYRYPTTSCDTAYNSLPIHLEQVMFTTISSPTAVSRASHGAAGTFDIPLPLTGTPGVECRSGGAGGNYQLAVTFAVPVTITAATVTPGSGGTGSVSGVPIISGNQVTVNLTSVSNAQTLTVNLIGVNDGSNTENILVPMSVLVGDTNGNGSVNSSDVSQVKSQSGKPVTASNFRQDVIRNGLINSSDIALTKSKSGSGM